MALLGSNRKDVSPINMSRERSGLKTMQQQMFDGLEMIHLPGEGVVHIDALLDRLQQNLSVSIALRTHSVTWLEKILASEDPNVRAQDIQRLRKILSIAETRQTTPQPLPHRQEQSKLMQLPQEIRELIFSHFFCSTRFSSGKNYFERPARRVVPAFPGTALAVLRSCRRINREIGLDWIGQVLFHFEESRAMLSNLGKLDRSKLGLVRHVRVVGDFLMLPFGEDDIFYRVAQSLKLLPGLNLNVLTVLGSPTAEVSYDILDMLVRYGGGFKELRSISHSSEFLGYKDDIDYSAYFDTRLNRYLRQPQPSNWQQALQKRDGSASKPSVVIYRSKSAGPNTIHHPEQRTAYSQTFAAEQDASNYGKLEDSFLMKAGEREKEVMMVVRRGEGIDHVEKQGSAYLPCRDIRQEFL